jgi:thiamine-phosphate pyrophosphorylase
MIARGRALRDVTRAAGVPLIVNDNLDVALAIDAEGLHVGQSDLSADMARRLLGPQRILGVSAATVEKATLAERAGADYLGVGDIYGTPSKPDAGPPIGLARITEIARAVSIPIIGIGGITEANAAAVIDAGADGVAVIAAIVGAPDPEAAARSLRTTISHAQLKRRDAAPETPLRFKCRSE